MPTVSCGMSHGGGGAASMIVSVLTQKELESYININLSTGAYYICIKLTHLSCQAFFPNGMAFTRSCSQSI